MPLAVVTKTSKVPDVRVGVTAVIEVADTTVNAALTPPNFTAVAPVKTVPVIVTVVPPAAGPLVGLTAVTVGGPTNVN